jgi:hypothetical protein
MRDFHFLMLPRPAVYRVPKRPRSIIAERFSFDYRSGILKRARVL